MGAYKDQKDRDHVNVIAKVYIGGGSLEGREKGLGDGLDGGRVEQRGDPDVGLQMYKWMGGGAGSSAESCG